MSRPSNGSETLPANATPDTPEQSPARELDAETIERLEQRAMSYLDTADKVLEAINSYADELITLHPENFEGISINDRDLIALADFGTRVRESSAKIARNQRGNITVPYSLFERLIPQYKGLAQSEVCTSTSATKAKERVYELSPVVKAGRIDDPEFEETLEELSVAARDLPGIHDTSVVVALSFIRLSQFFQQKAVQKGVASSSRLSPGLATADYLEQGAYFAGAYYLDRNMAAFKNTLRELVHPSEISPEKRDGFVDSYLSELQLFETRTQLMKEGHNQVGAAYKAAIDSALEQAATTMQQLAESTSSFDSTGSDPEEDLSAKLAIEAQAISANKKVIRKAKNILDIANSLRRQDVLLTPQFYLSQEFPTLEARIANQVKQEEAARIAGVMATTQASKAERQQSIYAELANLQTPYTMTRSEIRKIPGSNELTALMVKGEVGDEETTAGPLIKEDAFAAAGLVYRLNEQLAEQTRNRVLDKLFAAYEQEQELLAGIDNYPHEFSLTAACDWLIENVAALQASESEVLCRLGDELALYGRTHRTPIGQRLERAARQISPRTLQAIEAARIDAESLDIVAFPPGVSNLEALEEDILDMMTRPGRQKIPMVDWARLVSLDDLSVAYTEKGYEAQLFRLLPGSLKERFPYYALLIQKDEHKVVVAENPKTGNATYVFEEFDSSLATWIEMVQLDKKAVRELGGRAMRHDPKHSLTKHFERVNDEVVLRLTAG